MMTPSAPPALAALLPPALFALAATLTPGGATMLATASGVRFGLRRSWPLILGIAAGLGTLAAASAAGLAALLATAPTLRLGLKLAGSAYLVWLALQIARQGAPGVDTSVSPSTDTPSNSRSNSPARVQGFSREQTPIGFAAGVGLLWTNPKAWTMTLGAAASFGVLSQDPVRLAGLMGGAFAVAALFSLMIWCCAGWMLARLLRASWQWRMLNLALSLLLLVSVGAIWRHT